MLSTEDLEQEGWPRVDEHPPQGCRALHQRTPRGQHSDSDLRLSCRAVQASRDTISCF